jgi:hypothetical protein
VFCVALGYELKVNPEGKATTYYFEYDILGAFSTKYLVKAWNRKPNTASGCG